MPRKAASSGDPSDLIKQAIAGMDAQIRDLTTKRDQLAKLLPEGGGSATYATKRRGRPPGSKNKAAESTDNGKPKRKVSAATRKKLKAAAQARWAKIKEEQTGS